jgi:hypothetical protein
MISVWDWFFPFDVAFSEHRLKDLTFKFFGVVYSEKQDFPVSLLFNELYKWLDEVDQN